MMQQTEFATMPGNRPARLTTWQPWSNPTHSLAGYATVAFPGWAILNRLPIFRDPDGGLKVGIPSAPELDGEGKVKVGRDGKRKYYPLLTFACAADRERYERAVLAALADAGIGGEP